MHGTAADGPIQNIIWGILKFYSHIIIFKGKVDIVSL